MQLKRFFFDPIGRKCVWSIRRCSVDHIIGMNILDKNEQQRLITSYSVNLKRNHRFKLRIMIALWLDSAFRFPVNLLCLNNTLYHVEDIECGEWYNTAEAQKFAVHFQRSPILYWVIWQTKTWTYFLLRLMVFENIWKYLIGLFTADFYTYHVRRERNLF